MKENRLTRQIFVLFQSKKNNKSKWLVQVEDDLRYFNVSEETIKEEDYFLKKI